MFLAHTSSLALRARNEQLAELLHSLKNVFKKLSLFINDILMVYFIVKANFYFKYIFKMLYRFFFV